MIFIGHCVWDPNAAAPLLDFSFLPAEADSEYNNASRFASLPETIPLIEHAARAARME
jgi:hypothetical protein